MKVRDVVNYIETIAPPALQESYDNSGLLVGDAEATVKGVMLSLDVTEAVVQEAIDNNCNLIVAHHPIIFSGLKRLTGRNYIEKTVIKAIKNDVAIFVAHTNLDNIQEGVNRKICEKLHIKNPRILSPKKGILKRLITFIPKDHVEQVREAIFEAGGGKIGDYDQCSFNTPGEGTFRGNENSDPTIGEAGEFTTTSEVKTEIIFPAFLERQVMQALKQAHPYEEVAYDIIALENEHQLIGSGMIGELEEPVDEMEFLQRIKSNMAAGCVRYTAVSGKKVKKVAVCGGSGSFLLSTAISQGADVFVTADFKYHQFFDAEGKIVIADIGHYESEQFTTEIFYDILTKKFSTFAVLFAKTNTNPIKYL